MYLWGGWGIGYLNWFKKKSFHLGGIIWVGVDLQMIGLNFFDSFGKSVGCGNKTGFWQDRWKNRPLLKDRFKRLYSLEVDKQTTISSRGQWINGSWVWIWHWSRELWGRELGELEQLREWLGTWAPQMQSEDKIKWLPGSKGCYNVKELRVIAEDKFLRLDNNSLKIEWNNLVPKKVGVFIWKVRQAEFWSLLFHWWDVKDIQNWNLDALCDPFRRKMASCHLGSHIPHLAT